MPSIFPTRVAAATTGDAAVALRRRFDSPWLAAAILVIAVVQQAMGHLTCDSSWFMTFAEKVLGGAVAYVDVSDPNPPAAFLAYVPSLLLARLLRISPELAVVGLTFTGGLGSIVASGTILSKGGLLRPDQFVPASSAAIFVILVVPASCFAQREHFAVILLLPFLALCAARARGAAIHPAAAISGGLAAGLALAFKPYYVLPFGLAAVCAPLQLRRWRATVTPEAAAAGVLVCLYGLVVAKCFPAFFDQAMPLVRDLYLPARAPLLAVARLPAFLVTVATLLAVLHVERHLHRDPRIFVLLAASVGFMATYLIQAKGWMNHAYPGLALALLAGTFAILNRRNTPETVARRSNVELAPLLTMFATAPLFFGSVAAFAGTEEFPGLQAEVRRLAPAHPKLAALAEEADLGHPLVRQLDGRWVGQQNCLWISYAVRYFLSVEGRDMDATRRARLLALKDRDERRFEKEIRDDEPDVLLVETPQLEEWARQEAALANLFQPYRRAGHAGTVSIWLRAKG